MVEPIQYLRAIAALMVVWQHARVQIPGLEAALPWDVGAHGVNIFFVVSGFIMAHTSKRATPWAFMQRRIVRVVPLYWLMTLVTVALAWIAPNLFRSTSIEAGHVLQSLLFIQHESPTHAGKLWPVLVPGWSLNYEMLFYAAFAISLLVKHRLAALAALLAAASLGPYEGWMLVEFAAGVLVSKAWERFGIKAWGLWMLAGIGLMAVTPLGAALVVYGSLGMTWRSPTLMTLGHASYSIYLSHLFALGALRGPWIKLGAPGWLFMIVGLAASAVVGCLVYRFAEAPMQRLFQPGPKVRPAAAQA
jgi:exopolysaccharide production protein ExoZ